MLFDAAVNRIMVGGGVIEVCLEMYGEWQYVDLRMASDSCQMSTFCIHSELMHDISILNEAIFLIGNTYLSREIECCNYSLLGYSPVDLHRV